MKTFVLTIALIILMSGSPLFADGEPKWGDLDAWVGKYPTDEQAGGTRRLLELEPVRSALRELLSPADFKLLDSVYSVEIPITKVGRFVVVEQCMPHNCPSAHAMVVLDSEDDRLWVGLFERAEKSVSTRWYGTDDYVLLPQPILDAFVRSHTGHTDSAG